MGFSTGLRMLREEKNMTQAELASALSISLVTMNRWENNKCIPHNNKARALLVTIRAMKPSKATLEYIQESLFPQVAKKKKRSISVASASQMLDNSISGILIIELKTHRFLYINKTAEEMFNMTFEELRDRDCYQVLFKGSCVCETCKLNELSATHFTITTKHLLGKKRLFRMKRVQWNGYDAALIDVMDYTDFTKQQETVLNLFERVPIPTGYYSVYSDGRIEILKLNDPFYELLDPKYRDLPDSYFSLDRVHPEDREKAKQVLLVAADDENEGSYDFRFVFDDGNTIWLSAHGSRLYKTRDRAIVIVVFSNPSKRIQAQEEKEQHYAQLETMLNLCDAAISLTRLTGDRLKVFYINDACAEFFEGSKEEVQQLYSNNPYFGVPEEDLDVVNRCAESMRRGENTNVVYRIRTLKNHTKWISNHSVFSELNGEMIACTTFYDVTAKQEADHTFFQMLDQIPTGIVVSDLHEDGKIYPLHINEVMRPIFSTGEEQFLEAIAPEDRQHVLEQVKKFSHVDLDLRILQADGKFHWYNLKTSLLPKRNGVQKLFMIFHNNEEKHYIQSVLSKQREVTDMVMVNNGIGLWTYNLDLKKIEQPFSVNGYEGYPSRIENGVDTMIARGMFAKESEADARRMYADLHNGAVRSECYASIYNPKKNCYTRNHLIMIRQQSEEGRVAIGVCIPVEEVSNSVE